MRILVTGGAGYIGSHTCVELLNEGYEVVIVDNLYNANKKAVDRVEEITGKKVTFYEADICDKEAMDAIFDKEDVQAVIHFAGLKAVGESTVKPLEYYQNNIAGTLTLCDVISDSSFFYKNMQKSHHVLGQFLLKNLLQHIHLFFHRHFRMFQNRHEIRIFRKHLLHRTRFVPEFIHTIFFYRKRKQSIAVHF